MMGAIEILFSCEECLKEADAEEKDVELREEFDLFLCTKCYEKKLVEGGEYGE